MAERLWWLAMDFGVHADVAPLYQWLDHVNAKECCEGLATFRSRLGDEDLATQLLRTVGAGDVRLYLVGRKENGNLFGRFIQGGRRRPPWEGYDVDTSDVVEEEE